MNNEGELASFVSDRELGVALHPVRGTVKITHVILSYQ